MLDANIAILIYQAKKERKTSSDCCMALLVSSSNNYANIFLEKLHKWREFTSGTDNNNNDKKMYTTTV